MEENQMNTENQAVSADYGDSGLSYDNGAVTQANGEMDLLAAEFGFKDESIDNSLELTQNLEGFASCFPDWDLHPPVEY